MLAKIVHQSAGIDKAIEAKQGLESTLETSVKDVLSQTKSSKESLEKAERVRDEMQESSNGLIWTGMMAMSVKEVLMQMKISSLEEAERGRVGIQESFTVFTWSGLFTNGKPPPNSLEICPESEVFAC